jgi:chemotaxis protein methyltransferase CheR
MMEAPSAADVDRFRLLVATRLGLHFDDSRLAFLAEVLRRRLDAVGDPAERYLARLAAPSGHREEVGALAAELTVPETYFFRHLDQFRAMAETAIPNLMRARAASRSLRFLSAGCASGDEAYSLAILVRQDLGGAPGWEIAIQGVDVNTVMLAKARRARYSAWSLRETPVDIQRRWFHAQGGEFTLDPDVRSMVVFEVRNLVDEDASFWRSGTFDVIFCRNVLMYLSPEQGRALAERLGGALAPGGYLFLGHAETLRGLSNEFHLRHTQGTFYYQRKASDEERRMPAGLARSELHANPSPGGPAIPIVEASDSWADVVRRAAERIEHLTGNGPGASPSSPPSASTAPRTSPSWDLGRAFDLFRNDRFAEALTVIRSLPPESAVDPDVLLLRAVLLAHGGDLSEAERVCADLLALDDLNAGAHYLLAICREGLGDRQGARDHDQVAAYLDPGFAMPRLHLGLLARRAGFRESARRDLGQALVLLQREDPSRVLLFGGGFSRDALVSLCRAELLATGGVA